MELLAFWQNSSHLSVSSSPSVFSLLLGGMWKRSSMRLTLASSFWWNSSVTYNKNEYITVQRKNNTQHTHFIATRCAEFVASRILFQSKWLTSFFPTALCETLFRGISNASFSFTLKSRALSETKKVLIDCKGPITSYSLSPGPPGGRGRHS